ncbi:MAG: mandelate racemase/muconate lactonizing enzyme family protein [Promethearchaeota archaeon]|nr:MAG: mandelate racemase/muconate lactonizing enzyme family protein [Candidatus Lokiarchaeota archaeon]
MKITDVKTYLLELDFKIKIGSMPRFKATGLYTNILTDEGIDGWALSHWNLSNLAQKHFIDEALKRLVVKKDPFMVEEIFNEVYQNTNRIMFGIPVSTSAIQIACWDIIGKATKQPIYKLLGGRKNKIKAYASMPRGYSAKAAVGAVEAALNPELGGFKAVKLRIGNGVKKDEELIKNVRDAFPDIDIMLDANSAYHSVKDAVELAKVCDKYRITWLEEPIPTDNLNGLAKIREQAPVEIAGGENDFGIYRFEDILSKECFDIVQPDVTRSGGYLQLKKIDAMAEVKGVRCIPHIFGFGHILAANLHFVMSTRCEWCEFPFIPDEYQLLEEPIKAEKGWVSAIDKPGLGVEINKEMFEKNVLK